MGTCPRPGGTSYLAETLESLRRSGWPPRLRIHVVDSGARTRNENGLWCLEVGFMEAGPEGWVLFLEDDLEVCDHFLARVNRWLDVHARPATDPPALYSFYCPYGRSARAPSGCWDYPLSWFNGCQAFALRSTHISGALLDMRPRLAGWDGPGGFDRLLSAWLSSTGGSLYASNPSFVQHVGVVTAMGYPHGHCSPTFPGVGVDREPPPGTMLYRPSGNV